MLVLVAGERILLQREAKITIKYKPRGEEKWKGTFYITNLRLVFEDSRKGIIMQVSPSQYELQAWRISKSMLGGEKLMLDIEKRVEGKSLFANAEVELKGMKKKEVEEALQTLLNSSSSSSSIMTTVSSSSKSSSSSRNSSTNYSMSMKKEEEERTVSKDQIYEELGFDIYEGDEIVKYYHDIRIEGHYYSYEVNDIAKIIITKYEAYAITPEGCINLGGPPQRTKAYVDSKEKNVLHVLADPDRTPKDGREYKLTFKNEEEAREACEAYIQTRKNRLEKKDLGDFVGVVVVKTMTYDPPRLRPYTREELEERERIRRELLQKK
ncbi:MAG: hypothetical protein QW416_09115 [Candidatus Nitrosocaldaceae archaeon]